MILAKFRVARNGNEFAEVDEAGLREGMKSGQILASDHCWSAGFGQWQRVDTVLSKLNEAKAQSHPALSPARSGGFSSASQAHGTASVSSSGSLVPHLWAVFVLGLLAWAASALVPPPKWEYQTIRVLTSQQSERTGSQAMKYSSIDADALASQLLVLGRDGWEVVGATVEMETAWPNFGNNDYVTGLQPNIRPQSMLVILKRQRPLF